MVGMTELLELDVVRVVQFLKPTRYLSGTESVKCEPRIGDIGAIVHEYAPKAARGRLAVYTSGMAYHRQRDNQVIRMVDVQERTEGKAVSDLFLRFLCYLLFLFDVQSTLTALRGLFGDNCFSP